jgi:hypothetical protein
VLVSAQSTLYAKGITRIVAAATLH